MRAMPSPTSTMRPTCCFSTLGWKPSRCLRRTLVISSASIESCVSDNALPQDVFSELFKAVADRAVDDRVAHPGHDAADDGGVLDDLQLHLLARGPLEGLGEAALLFVVEHDGGADLGHLVLALGRRPLDQT